MLDTERCMETIRERIIDEYKKSGITSIEKFSEKCKVSYNTCLLYTSPSPRDS